MKVGRNDPCPCGSGKKYKKCCLAKDEAAARQGYAQRTAVLREAAQVFDAGEPLKSPAPDPLEEARESLWDEFESAKDAQVPALFRRVVAENEALDAELAFEMICAIRDNHDRATFAEALDALSEQRPDLYQHDAEYYLGWRIADALAAGELSRLPELGAAMAEAAGKELDSFYPVIDRLAYHGQLALAARMMALAWPQVKISDKLVSGAATEFARRAIDLTLLAFYERSGELRADDAGLIAALEVFAPVDRERLAAHIALLAGQDQRAWTLEDFTFRPPARRVWDDEGADEEAQSDPAAQNLDDLTQVFLGELYRAHGVSLARGELARMTLAGYILERHAGELEPVDSPFERVRKPKGRKTASVVRQAPANPLCPDRATLDRFLAGMLNLIGPQHHVAAATLELMPAWLRFLESRSLLTAEQRGAALADLHKLVVEAAPIWKRSVSDPSLGANIRLAWERAQAAV
jgi:hypothetical protein